MKGLVSLSKNSHISPEGTISTEKLDLIIFCTLFFLSYVLIADAYELACTTTLKRLRYFPYTMGTTHDPLLTSADKINSSHLHLT